MTAGAALLAMLPVAVYTTDPEGRLTFYNDAAAELWGHRPEIGSSRWCGSWKLFWPDGRPLAHEDCPMGVTLREGHPVRGLEAVAERPDGTRVPFRPYPSLLRDAEGRVTGAINLLVDLTEQKRSVIESDRLAAIVSSSDDAIISKTLEGRITSWNAGATRIFGYTAEEMVGQSILRLIPPELQHEEDEILARLRRGERIDHFDTVRLTKDGRRIDISLTVSPVRDGSGTIVGASKVARDVSDRKRHEAMQRLLFDELNHRVKNTLAKIQSIASLSLRRSTSPQEFVRSFNGRVQALAKAHDLLVQGKMQGADLHGLVREQVTLGPVDASRIVLAGPRVKLDSRSAVQMALVLHELATNAHKYGALSVPSGHLAIRWQLQAGATPHLHLEWTETGVPGVSAPTTRGFGSTLIERSLAAVEGQADLHFKADGLACEIRMPLTEVEERTLRDEEWAHGARGDRLALAPSRTTDLQGKRVLIVEDEPLVAIDIEEQLTAAGAVVVGPAASVDRALLLIAEASFDVALLDGNLGGQAVDEIAAALTRRNIPFAFATGYGLEGLPRSFREAKVLEKPFSEDQLIGTVVALLSDRRDPLLVVSR
jgi:PAS domain S-box-containing protein